MQILLEHFFNLGLVINEFQDDILAFEPIAHHNSQTSNDDDEIFFYFEEGKMTIFNSFIDSFGNIQYLFEQPGIKDLFYISVIAIEDQEKLITDKIIFQLIRKDEIK